LSDFYFWHGFRFIDSTELVSINKNNKETLPVSGRRTNNNNKAPEIPNLITKTTMATIVSFE